MNFRSDFHKIYRGLSIFKCYCVSIRGICVHFKIGLPTSLLQLQKKNRVPLLQLVDFQSYNSHLATKELLASGARGGGERP